VPSCLIHDEDGVGIVGDVSGDFDQVLVHGMGIAPRHDKGGGLAVFGAYRPEDIGGACALVVRCRWPCSTLGPASCDLVLLAYPGFVLVPDFNAPAFGGTGGNFCHSRGEFFLNASAASASCA